MSTDSCVADSTRAADYAQGALTHAAARRPDGTLASQTEYTNIDPLGRVLDSKQTTAGLDSKSFVYQYAVGGALASVTYPSGRVVSYDINGANRVSRVRNGPTGSSYYAQGPDSDPQRWIRFPWGRATT